MRNRLFVFVLVLTLALGFTTVVSADNDTIIIGSGAEAPGLDPRRDVDIPSFERINVIMENLVTFDLEMKLVPQLATDWWFSDDGLTLSFKLREGVLWHDGEPFSAEDVKYTYDWLLNPDNPAPNRSLYAVIDNIEIEDPYTIHFHLASPNSFLLNNMARMSIVPKHHGDRADFQNNPVGTGPYKFVSWTRDDRLVLEAFADYWQGVPLTPYIVFRPIPEDATRLMAFEAGEIDMYQGGMVPHELPRLERDPRFVVQRAPGTGYDYLGLNTQVGYLADVRVRKALSHLLHREAIVAQVRGGIGTPGVGPVPPTLPWYNDDVPRYEYNLDEARQYLAEAGYPDGGFTLRLYTNENPIRIRIAEILQFTTARVGIEVEIIVEEWGAYLDRIQHTDDYDIFILGWSGQLDPDRAMYRQFHTDGSFNFTSFSNERLDYLLAYGQTVPPDSEESLAIYREAQEIVVENVPYAFINYSEEVGVSHPYIEGWVMHPYPANTWQSAHLFVKNK